MRQVMRAGNFRAGGEVVTAVAVLADQGIARRDDVQDFTINAAGAVVDGTHAVHARAGDDNRVGAVVGIAGKVKRAVVETVMEETDASVLLPVV